MRSWRPNCSEGVCGGLETIHELWAAPIELGLGLWLLQRQVGTAFLGPAAVVVCCTAVITWISKRMAGVLTIWLEGIQTRVDVTTSMLGSMKVNYESPIISDNRLTCNSRLWKCSGSQKIWGTSFKASVSRNYRFPNPLDVYFLLKSYSVCIH